MKKMKQPTHKRFAKLRRAVFAKRKYLYFLLPIALIAIYLNTANNHFYHRLHTSGLVWPQNQTDYLIGDGARSPISYVALGDSLTAGVGADGFNQTYSYAVAQQVLETDQPILLTPLATPGYKSIDLVNHYLNKTIELQPDLITILIGVNDVHGLGPSNSEFRDNYETLLKRMTTETNAHIYTINIPFIGTDSLIWPPYKNYYSARTQSFNKIILDLARKYSVGHIDIYTETLQYASKPSIYYSRDDFHPSGDGYRTWANIIARDINK